MERGFDIGVELRRGIAGTQRVAALSEYKFNLTDKYEYDVNTI